MADPLDPFTQALVFVLASLAAYRASRLVTRDSLLHSWRARWFRRFPPNETWREDGSVHPLGQLVDCPWCFGFWCAGITWGWTWRLHELVLPGLWWPAMAVAVGALGAMLER